MLQAGEEIMTYSATDNGLFFSEGTYDPIPKPARPDDPSSRPYKDIKLDRSRAQYWLGVGAQPSDTCWRLMSMVRPNPPALQT